MREIKFRVWDKDVNKMLFFDSIFNKKPFTETSSFPQYQSSPKIHELSDSMQYTELKDKNNNDIYEGDIVVATWYWEEPHVIILPDDYYAFHEYHIGEEMTVIGNIYENPELLKQ